MFVQVLHGKVRDRALFAHQAIAWGTELRPNAVGWLGMTWGVTSDDVGVLVARFESAEAAHSNRDSDGQEAWGKKLREAFDGEPLFLDSENIDLLLGGGSDGAAFVQVMQGRAKDKDAFRDGLPEFESVLRALRPDLLGAIVIWAEEHDFTQVAYFESETDARRNEQVMANDPSFQRFSEMLDEPMSFYDLSSPRFH